MWFSISGFATWTPTPQQRVSFQAVQVLKFLLIRVAEHQTGSWQDQGRRWLGGTQVEESNYNKVIIIKVCAMLLRGFSAEHKC